MFDACENLGVLNLRGTGFATRDMEVRELSARIDGVDRSAEVNVSGLAGFLLAKAAAAHSRRQAKDWYDIAFVLLHNDAGGPAAAAELVRDRFAGEIDAVAAALRDLRAKDSGCTGTESLCPADADRSSRPRSLGSRRGCRARGSGIPSRPATPRRLTERVISRERRMNACIHGPHALRRLGVRRSRICRQCPFPPPLGGWLFHT